MRREPCGSALTPDCDSLLSGSACRPPWDPYPVCLPGKPNSGTVALLPGIVDEAGQGLSGSASAVSTRPCGPALTPDGALLSSRVANRAPSDSNSGARLTGRNSEPDLPSGSVGKASQGLSGNASAVSTRPCGPALTPDGAHLSSLVASCRPSDPNLGDIATGTDCPRIPCTPCWRLGGFGEPFGTDWNGRRISIRL